MIPQLPNEGVEEDGGLPPCMARIVHGEAEAERRLSPMQRQRSFAPAWREKMFIEASSIGVSA